MHNSRHSSTVIEAENPRYGTHLHPPPKQKAPKYTKVGTEAEPTYELIQGSATVLTNGNSTDGRSGDPVYSMPMPAKRELKKDVGSPLPLYESAMDIPASSGKDGEYSKLSHDKVNNPYVQSQ